MVKINRKIGAVAVYSPLRAGLLVLVVTALLLGGGFGFARLVDNEAEADRSRARAEVPSSVRVENVRGRLDAAEARAEKLAARLQKVRSQRATYARRIRRMRRAGLTAEAGAARLRTGRPYVVVLKKGRRGADYVIGARHAFRAGMSYRRCSDGRGVCARRDAP